MDNNGYNDSIMHTIDGTCYVCGRVGETARHEVYGAANRSISKEHGFWVNVCPNCHQNAPYAIHRNPMQGTDLQLKKDCQRAFEERHTRTEFVGLIGKSYL